jgi:hypothetical protein
MVDLEVKEWGGVQQEGLVIPGGACLQNLDAIQVLAPAAQTEAEANSREHDQFVIS